MFCSRLLRLALLALCTVSAAAQGAAADRYSWHGFLPVNSELFSFHSISDAFSRIAAAFGSRGAFQRRLSLQTFLSSERGEQLLGSVRERGREEKQGAAQQAQQLSSLTEAVSSPGTQLETYLPENQRPLAGLKHEDALSAVVDARRLSRDIAATAPVGVPWCKDAREPRASQHYSRASLAGPVATTVQSSAAPHGTDKEITRFAAARAVGDGDTASAAFVAASETSELAAATAARQAEQPEVKDKQTAVHYSQDKTAGASAETAAAPLLSGDTTGAAAAKAALANPAANDAPPDLNRRKHRLIASGIYGVSTNASRALGTQNVAVNNGTGVADLVPTSSVVSSTLSALSAAAGASTGWLQFGGSSSSSAAQEQQTSAGGTGKAASNLATELKKAAGTVKGAALEQGKKAVGAVRDNVVEEGTRRSGPFSKLLWFLTSSKEEKHEAATETAVKTAISNLTKDHTAVAGTLSATFGGATKGVSRECPSPAAAKGEEPADIRESASSFTYRFLPQWLAQQTEKIAPEEALNSAAATQAAKGWWLSGDRSHASEKQHQQQPSRSRSWWSTSGASESGLGKAVDTVEAAVLNNAKVVSGISSQSAHEKSEKSTALSNLLTFLTSSKDEKKKGAAKAAVEAALSWIADCQQHMQATLKTLSPASTSQTTARDAAPVAFDAAAAAAFPWKGKATDAVSQEQLTFFRVGDFLQRLSARQQQLSEFTNEEAEDWYRWMRQRVMEQGLTAALANWLYAGGSDDSTSISSPPQPYFPSPQHGIPAVSSPFFPTGLWSTANGSDVRRQPQAQQPVQTGPRPQTLTGWLRDTLTGREARSGAAQEPPAVGEQQQRHTAMQDGLAAWIPWIGGNQQTTGTTPSTLIRKAATATSPVLQEKLWSEKSTSFLPLAGVAGWLPSSRGSSHDTAMNSSHAGSLWSSESVATEAAAASKPEDMLTAAAGAAGGGLVPTGAMSLQSAFVEAQKAEDSTLADDQRIRAPGLQRGAYWWEWRPSPSGEATERTKTPMYTRHVHLECDPVLPFQACVHDCQKESARSLQSSSSTKKAKDRGEGFGSGADTEDARTDELNALGSYEYTTLRSCYLKCKQKWLDTTLPGCLTADGVKVEGVPPATAFRATRTTTTTTTTTSPAPSPAAAEAPPLSTEQPKGFWSRLRGEQQVQESSIAKASSKSPGKSFFSLFGPRVPADKSSPPASVAEKGDRSIKNLFGLLQRQPMVPQTAAPSVKESIARFPQSLWNHLRSGEASAADASAAATILPGRTEAAPAGGAKDAHAKPAHDVAGDDRSWWSAFVRGGEKGEQQPQSAAPTAAEQRIYAAQTPDKPEAAKSPVESRMTFNNWCVLLMLCMGGALVSICVVALRRREILTRVWSMFHSGRSAHAAASWQTLHALCEHVSPKDEGCVQQCVQKLSFCSAEVDTNAFEKSGGAMQPLMSDDRPSL